MTGCVPSARHSRRARCARRRPSASRRDHGVRSAAPPTRPATSARTTPLAGLRDAAARRSGRDPGRAGRHPRGRVRPADRQSRGPAVRRASLGRIAARVSFGILNLTHRDSHETPSPLTPGQRYQVRIQLNDAGVVFPAGHRIRLALSTTYWPMIWPAPEPATVTIFGGALDLPVRPPRAADALLPPLPGPETAPPERPTSVRPGVVRIDRIGLELGTEGKFTSDIEDDDPLSAVIEMRKTETTARRLAGADRDDDAHVLHARRLPAAGDNARLGRRPRSLPSRLGSRHSPGLGLTVLIWSNPAAANPFHRYGTHSVAAHGQDRSLVGRRPDGPGRARGRRVLSLRHLGLVPDEMEARPAG